MQWIDTDPPHNLYVPEYDTEDEAQDHCPRDTVVWLNTTNDVWHEKGTRNYGNTYFGAYVCRHEAAAAGGHESLDGT
jgi:hypothetical protein